MYKMDKAQKLLELKREQDNSHLSYKEKIIEFRKLCLELNISIRDSFDNSIDYKERINNDNKYLEFVHQKEYMEFIHLIFKNLKLGIPYFQKVEERDLYYDLIYDKERYEKLNKVIKEKSTDSEIYSYINGMFHYENINSMLSRFKFNNLM